jgi:hypothetical protein
MADEIEIRDFTNRDTTIKFKIYQHVLEAAPELPLGAMTQIAKLQNLRAAIDENGLESILDILDIFVLDDSMQIIRGMVNDKKKPFGVRHMMELVPWLLEEYGLRPTQPSSPSSTGSVDGETGISSMDGVQQEASALLNSPSVEPSI